MGDIPKVLLIVTCRFPGCSAVNARVIATTQGLVINPNWLCPEHRQSTQFTDLSTWETWPLATLVTRHTSVTVRGFNRICQSDPGPHQLGYKRDGSCVHWREYENVIRVAFWDGFKRTGSIAQWGKTCFWQCYAEISLTQRGGADRRLQMILREWGLPVCEAEMKRLMGIPAQPGT